MALSGKFVKNRFPDYRARQASYSVAYAITHLDRPRFVVVYAAAIFALNPDGYTPTGGLTTDVSGGLTAVLDGEYGRSTEVTIEASARRGSTFSVRAEQNLNPYSGEINSFLKDVSKESVGDKFPFSTSVKKELWSGKFTLLRLDATAVR